MARAAPVRAAWSQPARPLCDNARDGVRPENFRPIMRSHRVAGGRRLQIEGVSCYTISIENFYRKLLSKNSWKARRGGEPL